MFSKMLTDLRIVMDQPLGKMPDVRSPGGVQAPPAAVQGCQRHPVSSARDARLEKGREGQAR